MSIKLENITKLYGTQKALDSVSFEANKGEIIALLGPNGAGKSTTMKIISSFLPADEGLVEVCGLDVKTQDMEIKKKLGYLPESNPLYFQMYVKEYLNFVADIHKLDQKSTRIKDVIERVGLGLEQNKKIGALSKGYKQRVGIAQSILHDPEVLILDEPTSGLDPNQLVEIRSLIHSLGKEKTVILSTHIMQEVEAICDRIIVIDRGRIVADDKTERLVSADKTDDIIHLELIKNLNEDVLNALVGVHKTIREGNNVYKLFVSKETDMRPALFDLVVKEGNKILEMRREKIAVEDVFQKLTKE